MQRVIMAMAAGALAACASSDTNHPTGPTQLVNLSLQPARIPPHENGAMLLSAATGCYVEYVGRGPADPIYQFRIGPTQRVPSIERCLSSLAIQPGVTGVAPVP